MRYIRPVEIANRCIREYSFDNGEVNVKIAIASAVRGQRKNRRAVGSNLKEMSINDYHFAIKTLEGMVGAELSA